MHQLIFYYIILPRCRCSMKQIYTDNTSSYIDKIYDKWYMIYISEYDILYIMHVWCISEISEYQDAACSEAAVYMYDIPMHDVWYIWIYLNIS